MLSRFFRKQKLKKLLKSEFFKNRYEVRVADRDYSNEDFFVKKAQKAQETLDKYGYPDMLTKGH